MVATLSETTPAGDQPSILGGLVYFSLLRNPGAAFSMATGMTWILALVAIGVVVAIVRIAPRLRSTPWAVALGLILGGALGNLTDRVFRAPGILRGHVVDFVSVFGPNAEYFPAFNVADSAITIGGITLVVTVLMGIDYDGTRYPRSQECRPADTGESEGCSGRSRSQAPRPMADSRLLPVPDGLAGERVDAGVARLLGPVPDHRRRHGRRGRRPGRRCRGAALAPAGRRQLARGHAAGAGQDDAGGRTGHHRPRRAATRTPTSWWSTNRSASRRTPVPGWDGPTVTGVLAARGFRLADSGAAERQGIVHRLDVGTTGVMAVARSDRAYRVLKAAFKARTVDKIYHAVAQGHPDPSAGTIDAPIGRHPKADWKFAVIAGGRDSVTHYDTLEAFPAASLLEIHLETGRTHQIRVHMAAIRHSLVGDLAYGADPILAERLKLHRQWLHAYSLGFEHPADGRGCSTRHRTRRTSRPRWRSCADEGGVRGTASSDRGRLDLEVLALTSCSSAIGGSAGAAASTDDGIAPETSVRFPTGTTPFGTIN